MRKFLFLAALGLLWVGVSNIWNAVVHAEPTSIPFTDTAVKSLPTHVKLTGIAFSPLDTVAGKFLGQSVAYVPIRAKEADRKADFRVVVRTNDPAMIAASTSPTLDGALTAWAKQLQRSEVTGMVDSTTTDAVLKQLHEANPLSRK